MRDQIGRYRLRLQSKSASVALLSLLICALSLAPVTFALDGADSWNQQIDSNGTITLTNGTILIQGSDNAAFGSPTSNTVTGLTTASSIGETVSFDWEYWTTDGAHYDRPQMLLNGVWVDLASDGQSASGTRAEQVTSGQAFGFRILSLDSCCGAGFLQISNTTWVVASPTPSPTPTPEPTPTLTPTPTAVVPSPSATPDPRRIGIAEPEPVHAARAVATAVAMTVGGAIGLLWGGAAVAQVVRRRFKRTVAFDDKLRDTGAPHK